MPDSEYGCLGAIGYIQFRKDCADMIKDSVLRQMPLFCNFRIGKTPGEETQDFHFTLGQPGSILCRWLFLISAIHLRRLQAFVPLEMAHSRSAYHSPKGNQAIPKFHNFKGSFSAYILVSTPMPQSLIINLQPSSIYFSRRPSNLLPTVRTLSGNFPYLPTSKNHQCDVCVEYRQPRIDPCS
jgi:hypothetical protein